VSRKEVGIRVMWIAEKIALQPQSIGCETAQVDHAQPTSVLQAHFTGKVRVNSYRLSV
jgi:hypothetical protein